MTHPTVLPNWFRRTLIAVATLLMCSCRAQGDECPTCPPGGAGEHAPAEGACQGGAGCPVAGGCVVDGCPVCQPGCYAGPGDEYLCDGGDRRPFSATVLRDGRMVGLEQEDTVAVYTGCEGRVLVEPSTRVCVYAPRFASVRQVVHPMGALQRDQVGGLGDVFNLAQADAPTPTGVALQNTALRGQVLPLPPGLYRGREHAGEALRLLAAADALAPVGPYGTLQLMHAGRVEMGEAPLVARLTLAAIAWTGDQELGVTISGQSASAVFSPKGPGLLYQINEGCPRLRLVKCASVDAALPGEEVEFTLRFDNVGDSALSDLVVLDNLTTRLEYVEGSAKSTRDADFSTARNDAGSLILQWKLADDLPAGEGGVLRFTCRVR